MLRMESFHINHQLKAMERVEPEALDLLADLLMDQKTIEKGQPWIMEGDQLNYVYLIVEGWAMRYKLLPDGRRQILNFQIPGDLIGFFSSLFNASPSNIEPLTTLKVQRFSPGKALNLFSHAPRMALALSWLAAQAERQLDEQIVRIGRRKSRERMAHLFMELHFRLGRAGFDETQRRDLPVTQLQLADALGMSAVHAHRTYREFCRENLITRHDNGVRLNDPAALGQICRFDKGYLDFPDMP